MICKKYCLVFIFILCLGAVIGGIPAIVSAESVLAPIECDSIAYKALTQCRTVCEQKYSTANCQKTQCDTTCEALYNTLYNTCRLQNLQPCQ